MKKSILILGAALALAGCDRPEGAASDQYTTDRGAASSRTISNTPSPAKDTTTITNQAPSIRDNSQGGATKPGGANSDTGTTTSTNTDSTPPSPTPPSPTPPSTPPNQ